MRKQKAVRFVLGSALAFFGTMLSTDMKVSAILPPTFITITPIPSDVQCPVGIDWLPTAPYRDQLLVSVNYPTGLPLNFVHVNGQTGAAAQWGSQAGWTDEIYFSSVRPNQGPNWVVGDVFSAKGLPPPAENATQIGRFAADGTLINGSFAVLPGETKGKSGDVVFDRFGVAGNDLIVVASNEGAGPSTVYRVHSIGTDAAATGTVTKLMLNGPGTDVNGDATAHLEGVTTVPQCDPSGACGASSMYGPWAGKILAGAEGINAIYAIDPSSGATAIYDPGALGSPDPTSFIRVEDLWVVPSGSAFYGVDCAENSPNKVWIADESQWTNKIGRIVVAQEESGQLYTIYWNPNKYGPGVGGFVSQIINPPFIDDGLNHPSHWEHITFIPTPKPHVSIVKKTNGVNADNPDAAGVPVIAPGQPVVWTYEVTNDGTIDIAETDVAVTDDVLGPITTIVSKGNNDAILSSGETWVYQATGTALHLSTTSGSYIVANQCHQGNASATGRSAYLNTGTVTLPTMSASNTDSYCNPAPHVTIVKKTNGVDANNPDAAGVPVIGAGQTVTWTYEVQNDGVVNIPQADISVSDNVIGAITTIVNKGDNDSILAPNETWVFQATGPALDLTTASGSNIVPNKCHQGSTSNPGSNAYTNIGKATIPGMFATDPDSYCNPQVTIPTLPHIKMVKKTNGVNANNPDAAGVPVIAAGQPVTWTYEVTNDGAVNIPQADISVTDNVIGSITTIVNKGNNDSILAPGETWVYQATGTALDLTTASGSNIIANKCHLGNPSNPGGKAYTNIGKVTIPNMFATDPDSYCNPQAIIPPPPPPPSGSIVSGDAATMGFWQNKNGQAVINCLNGGPNSTNLATWLSTNFPFLYGSGSSTNLTGKTNKDVAALFIYLFGAEAPKVRAQTMAVALASYVTSSTLSGGVNCGAKFGFNFSTNGTGVKGFNVGSQGTAIGLQNNTVYSVLQLLQQANLKAKSGPLSVAFNNIFDAINQGGDIK